MSCIWGSHIPVTWCSPPHPATLQIQSSCWNSQRFNFFIQPSYANHIVSSNSPLFTRVASNIYLCLEHLCKDYFVFPWVLGISKGSIFYSSLYFIISIHLLQLGDPFGFIFLFVCLFFLPDYYHLLVCLIFFKILIQFIEIFDKIEPCSCY